LNEKAHPSVISFYLKLIVHFKQKDAIPEMKELLSSGNIQIVKETIHALGELKDVHIEDFFIANYKYQPVECKIEILKALGKVNSKRHLNFLIQEFNETDILDIKKHAAKSLINKNPDSGKLLAFLYGDSKGLNNTVLHHVLNPLIKN
jgi:HEAT repeat protein